MDSSRNNSIKKADLSLCIICQEETKEKLVENPTSYDKTVQSIKEWASYRDIRYIECWEKICDYPIEELRERKASWHRSCYKNVVNSGKLKRAKSRYEIQLEGGPSAKKKSVESHEIDVNGQFTRSKTTPYNKDVCFFCDGMAGYRQRLHNVSTTTAGESLKRAIEKSLNTNLQVKLNSSINPVDAHAIDIKYHNKCWARNVTNVLRQRESSEETGASISFNSSCKAAAQIEFLTLTELTLSKGKPTTMAELEDLYEEILEANNAHSLKCTRKTLKGLLQREIPGIEFHKPKRINESERVTIKRARDFAVQLSEDCQESDENSDDDDCEHDMKVLFNAASILRKSMKKCKAWEFTGSFTDITNENIPEELTLFSRWLINGTASENSNMRKSTEIAKRALSLSQTIITLSLTERQKGNVKSQVFKSRKEMPQQLAVGLAVRQSIRSKEIVNMLHGFGMCVEYNRILRVEAQIEQNVLNHMDRNGGIFLPPEFVQSRHVFYAIDNSDFSEDTPDGKNTLHGTAMAIYQRIEEGDIVPEIRLEAQKNQQRTVQVPETLYALSDCQEPSKTPNYGAHPRFQLFGDNELPIIVRQQDFAWLLGRTLSRISTPLDTQDTGEPPQHSTNVPVWSAYNSVIHEPLDVTRRAVPPLIPSPAHEWSTLLTVLQQAQNINTFVLGPQRKTVISLDLGLYMPAKRLQMARNDLDHLILRPGELHIVMAQLRAIGCYIENSGLDMCWVEAELYGTSTAKQIIEGKHVRRGQTAHLITLQALFWLYQQAFFRTENQCHQTLLQVSKDLDDACASGKEEDIGLATERIEDAVTSLRIVEKMTVFDNVNGEKRPMFKVMRQYMRMVTEMLAFIRAVRTGNWNLHLVALAKFVRYFFAHDMINYARMIPLYLAEMEELKTSDPDIIKEFESGNWVVNQKGNSSFCAIGADHALEHVNRSMKVAGGLVGITQNPSARNKFFLISPELARLSNEAKNMAGLSKQKINKNHHNLTDAVRIREEKCVNQMKTTIERFTDPFEENSDSLFNLVTKAVVDEKVKQDLCNQSEIGKKMVTSFVSERITSNTTNLWSKMTKRKLLTWKKNGKKVKVAIKDKTIELQEDRSLFARLMMVAKCRPEVAIKEAIAKYEFSVVPRSLFANDGTMLYCSSKSTLMTILENIGEPSVLEQVVLETAGHSVNVAVVDGMAELQALDKPPFIQNCQQLADHFNERLFTKYSKYDEIRLIFDRYDIPSSLKTSTRERRQGGNDPVYYHITDSTNISKVNMKRLLCHTNTKMELTIYLSEKAIHYARQHQKRFVVSSGCTCQATHIDTSHLQSNHEEADTMLILHARDAANNDATTVNIHSPDTDVLVLLIRRYPQLCQDTNFVTGVGQRRRLIRISPIFQALGEDKAAALPAFHAISGADITGSFAGKGKKSCWKVFDSADDDVISALKSLGTTDEPDENTMKGIEKFVCQLYRLNSAITNVGMLRWLLFKKTQAQSERLPPTQGALREAVLRANYQTLIWNHDVESAPELPSPDGFGWKTDSNGAWVPEMTKTLPAPEAIIELVKCGCYKQPCNNNRCQCRKAGLACTELCECSNKDDDCENMNEDDINNDDAGSADSDESDDSSDTEA